MKEKGGSRRTQPPTTAKATREIRNDQAKIISKLIDAGQKPTKWNRPRKINYEAVRASISEKNDPNAAQRANTAVIQTELNISTARSKEKRLQKGDC